MAEHKVQLGRKIYLKLQLGDDDALLFPQVTLLDKDGSTVAGSPISLPHIAAGLYKDDSIVMPATDEVTAHYRVYSDALHTIRDTSHCDTLMDVYQRDFNSDLLDQINTNISSILSGNLPGDQVLGFIEDSEELTGLIIDDELSLIGQLFDGEELVGQILEEELLEGFLDSPDVSVIGFIEC